MKKNFFPPFVNGIICMFCWLLPPLRDIKAVSAIGIEQPHIYKRMFLYDEEKNAGYILQRDYKKGFHYLGEYLKTARISCCITSGTERNGIKQDHSLLLWNSGRSI
mgnify:FL=1